MQIIAGTSHGAQAAIGGDGKEFLPLEFKPNFPIRQDYKSVLTPPCQGDFSFDHFYEQA
jgi:hypothetical protein